MEELFSAYIFTAWYIEFMKLRVIDIGESGVKTAIFSYDGEHLKISSEIYHFSNPDWDNFESWLTTKVSNDLNLIGISSAGFVDSANGVVKMFRVGLNRPVYSALQSWLFPQLNLSKPF